MKCERCFHKPICEHYINIRNDTYARIGYNFDPDKCKDYVDTTNVVPVIHGKWKMCVGHINAVKCSECNCVVERGFGQRNFCQNCGAKMDGKESERDC